jgi:hypothetical protein
MNNIKLELEKIEIPKELNNRVALGVKQAKMETKRKKRYPKWMLASAASIIIIATGFTFGGSFIADAAESLISQLFGSKENLMRAYPDESQEEFNYFEQHLAIAKENLTEEEFNNYVQIINEETEIWSEVRKENREPNSEEAKRLNQLGELQQSYTDKFALKEVQQYASYTITKPTFTPVGYKQVDENYILNNAGDEPIVSLNYSDGDFWYWVDQQSINQEDAIDRNDFAFFEKPQSYSLNGFEFDYVSSKEKRVGMRVTVPEKGYKIIIIADVLSKEVMEKVVLSMIENE